MLFGRVKGKNDVLFIFNSGAEIRSLSFDRKLINAVHKGCYMDILINIETEYVSRRKMS